MIHFSNPFSKNQFEYAEPVRFSYGRWISYFNQVNEILKLGSKGTKLLEIGPGANVTHDVLIRFGFDLTTVDVNEENKPNIVSDVRELPFEDETFDIILCCEVLEHIPYEDFVKALEMFYKITKNTVIISLPTFGFEWVITVKFPKIPKVPAFRPFGRNLTISAIVSIPFKMDKKPPPHHQWEIGRKGYPLRRIKSDIRSVGFRIIKFFYVPEHPWFTFFVLSKEDKK